MKLHTSVGQIKNHTLNCQIVILHPLPSSWCSFFNYAYEALAVNEFHDFPADFSFTAPIDSSALPPLRITGDGVLKEFGFNLVRKCIPYPIDWIIVK